MASYSNYLEIFWDKLGGKFLVEIFKHRHDHWAGTLYYRVFLGMMKDKKWAGCTLLASRKKLLELLRNEEG